ncbi:MAG: hypothetical protein ABIN89_03465 [Chitinophagaceae bacterium]
MLKKYIILLVLISCVVHLSRAQDKSNKVRLQSVTNIGLLNGSKNSSFALQTILGGAYKNSFLGAGIGIDYYRFRTVPVFADLRHQFGSGPRKFFLYGDIGYNLDWLTDKNKEQENIYSWSSTNNFKGGLYYDAGIGYKFALKNSDAFVISTGYTFKKLKNKTPETRCPFLGTCSMEIDTYKYYLSRWVIKAGWSF